MSELALITDRTADDVKKAQSLTHKGLQNMAFDELTEWLAGLRGSYNYNDLNRVGEAVIYITERLKLVGWYIHTAAKIDWTIIDFPTVRDMQIYLDNVRLIRSCLPQNMPQVPPDMNNLTYEEANAIEQLLIQIDDAIYNIMKNVFFSGEIYAGEEMQ